MNPTYRHCSYSAHRLGMGVNCVEPNLHILFRVNDPHNAEVFDALSCVEHEKFLQEDMFLRDMTVMSYHSVHHGACDSYDHWWDLELNLCGTTDLNTEHPALSGMVEVNALVPRTAQKVSAPVENKIPTIGSHPVNQTMNSMREELDFSRQMSAYTAQIRHSLAMQTEQRMLLGVKVPNRNFVY